MKFIKNPAVISFWLSTLILGVFCVPAKSIASPSPIHLAIGPFFAPADNTAMTTEAGAMPDLLTAALSKQPGFQLVERQQVNAIWSEMHLSESGLTSADTVAKLGKILSCDLLVNGSFVQTPTGPILWVRVINPQTGRVLDLQDFPGNTTNLNATAEAIGRFITQVGERSTPREFIAVGRFEDQSTAPGREDWAPRIVAMIEKYFIASGYGVVEREAINPIFNEYQFQTSGLTGNDPHRVKLAPAFWLVDGGCKWVHTTEDKISVTIRFQRAGMQEQLFSFAKPPGDALEKALVETIQAALTNAGSITAIEAEKFEEKKVAAHANDLANGRGVSTPTRYNTNVTYVTVTAPDGSQRKMELDPMSQAMQERHANESLRTLQQAILLNPKDMKAKWFLGSSWFGSADAGENKQGEDMLEEVAASEDPVYAVKAKNWLDDIRSGKIEIVRDPSGTSHLVMHGQPASFPNVAGRASASPVSNPSAAPLIIKGHSTSNGLVTVVPIKVRRMIAGADPGGLYEPAEVTVTIKMPDGSDEQTDAAPSTPEGYRKLEEFRKAVYESLPKQPGNIQSRWLLGIAWAGSSDPEEQKQSAALLQQVVNAGDPFYAASARAWLADFQDGQLSFLAGPSGIRELVTRGQAESLSVPGGVNPWLPVNTNTTTLTDAYNRPVTFDPTMGEIAHIYTVADLEGRMDDLEGQVTACKYLHGQLMCGMGKRLYIIDATKVVSVDYPLPVALDSDISAIEVNSNTLWLGYGGNLLQINLRDRSVQRYGAENGFPGGSVTALCQSGEKLFMGFSSQRSGVFGYLNLASGKFMELAGGAQVPGEHWNVAVQPPDSPINAILSRDGQHFWVASHTGVQCFDSSANQWQAAGSGVFRELSAQSNQQFAFNSKFAATCVTSGSGVAICHFPGTNWVCLNLSRDLEENSVDCLAADPTNPDYLWIGGVNGRVTLLDTAHNRILVHGRFDEDITMSAFCPGPVDLLTVGTSLGSTTSGVLGCPRLGVIPNFTQSGGE